MDKPEATASEAEQEIKPEATGGDQQGKTFSQADVDRIVEARLAKERRSETYKELERKAAAYDKTVEESKSELQKAQERAAQLEAENKRIMRENLVNKVCLEKGIPAKFSPLITGDDEESITQSVELLAELKGESEVDGHERKVEHPTIPTAGISPHDEPSVDEQIRAAEQEGNVALAIALKSQKLLKHIR